MYKNLSILVVIKLCLKNHHHNYSSLLQVFSIHKKLFQPAWPSSEKYKISGKLNATLCSMQRNEISFVYKGQLFK